MYAIYAKKHYGMVLTSSQIVSDWGGTHSGWPAIEAGEDMDMPGTLGFTPGGPSYFGGNITTSVNNGSLSEDRLDDMCRRVLTPYFRLQQGTNYPPIDGSEPGLGGTTGEFIFPHSSITHKVTNFASSSLGVQLHVQPWAVKYRCPRSPRGIDP